MKILTLTYRGNEAAEDQTSKLTQILDQMNVREEERIVVTETTKSNRLHHHVASPGIDIEVLKAKWTFGEVMATEICTTERHLAEYLSKQEPSKTKEHLQSIRRIAGAEA